MKGADLTPEELEELSRKVKLKILHEDDDIVLMTAPNEEQLMKIIKELLSYKALNIREIHAVLSGIASEDKIRRALANLMAKEEVYINNEDGKYYSV